jgi:DnaJ-class molecular chaperone
LEEVDALGGSTASAYKTLGLQKGATPAEIKSAHRKMIVTLHPDRVSSLSEEEKV